MEEPKKYLIIYKSKNKFIHKYTNFLETAQKWGVKYSGDIYIDKRYKAKKRLYWYLWRKKEYGING